MDNDLRAAAASGLAEEIFDPKRIAIVGASYGGYATLAGMTRNCGIYACGIDIMGRANLETLLGSIRPTRSHREPSSTGRSAAPLLKRISAFIRGCSPHYQAYKISKPLPIAQGAHDPRVKQAESKQMAVAQRENGIPVAYLLFSDDGHNFARPGHNIAFHASAG
jgi:dipeptidyl aminopeptidase/acylaminoacyl peptidase